MKSTYTKCELTEAQTIERNKNWEYEPSCNQYFLINDKERKYRLTAANYHTEKMRCRNYAHTSKFGLGWQPKKLYSHMSVIFITKRISWEV